MAELQQILKYITCTIIIIVRLKKGKFPFDINSVDKPYIRILSNPWEIFKPPTWFESSIFNANNMFSRLGLYHYTSS